MTVVAPVAPGGQIEGHLTLGTTSVTVSSEHMTLVLNVPAGFDLTKFKNGDEVLATFTQQADGTLVLTALSGDENAQQADDDRMTTTTARRRLRRRRWRQRLSQGAKPTECDHGSADVSPPFVKRLSDENLGRRLASGEAAAFDELYRRYVHRLAAYGAHLLGDGAAGDDVAQAALLKAYGALRDGRVPDRMRPWLYRIAHNVAIDLVSRRREWPTAEVPEQWAQPMPRRLPARSSRHSPRFPTGSERSMSFASCTDCASMRRRRSCRSARRRSSSRSSPLVIAWPSIWCSAIDSPASRCTDSPQARSTMMSGGRSRAISARARVVAAGSGYEGARSASCR